MNDNNKTTNDDDLHSYTFQCACCGSQELPCMFETTSIESKVTSICYDPKIHREDVRHEQLRSEVFETEYGCLNCGERWESIADMIEDGSLTSDDE